MGVSNDGTLAGYCDPSIQNSTAVSYAMAFPFFADNYVVFDRVVPEGLWAPYKLSWGGKGEVCDLEENGQV